MMIIKSTLPLVWPHLSFSLQAGDNPIDEQDIPLAAHYKLVHLSRSAGKTTPARGEDDRLVYVDTPATISGYTPSQEFIAAAERLSPKRAMAKMPRVATLKTVKAESAPAPDKKPEDDKRK